MVIYDGWSLAYRPNSPSAIHLLTLLQFHPPKINYLLALPGDSKLLIPESGNRRIVPTPDADFGRIRWVQAALPRLAQEGNANIIHLFSGGAALFAATPSILSPCNYPTVHPKPIQPEGGRSFSTRVRTALAEGGVSRLNAMLLPSDLPDNNTEIEKVYLPPAVLAPHQNASPTVFNEIWQLPETFILYHGPHTYPDLRQLLDAWNWVAGPIGDYYPLLIPGCDQRSLEILRSLPGGQELEDTIRPLPELGYYELLWLYQNCEAMFHPAGVPAWGDPVRIALAYGKPVVGLEDPVTTAIVGEAAYLIPQSPPGEEVNRLLGAALISVIVERELAEALSKMALQRASRWKIEDFRRQLNTLYQYYAEH